MIQAYVLVETAIGCTDGVTTAIRRLTPDGARITKVDAITGPYDVIANFEAEDSDTIGGVVAQIRASHHGVQRTTTCLVVNTAASASNGRRGEP